MQLIRSIKNLKANQSFSCGVVTIGKYDGLHLGHQRILTRVLAKAHELNLPAVVILFEPMPYEYFQAKTKSSSSRLMTLSHKVFALEQLGLNKIVCLKFDKQLAKLSAEDFVKQILLGALNAKYVIVGSNFTFGHNRQGDSSALKKFAVNFRFSVEIVPILKIGSLEVNSTNIRNAVEAGDLLLAKKFLGQYYSIMGRVSYGLKYGRDIGFPTANIFLHHNAVPLSGVYVVRVRCLDAKNYYGVANIGFRPTLPRESKLFEVHIFNFKKDIYGRRIAIDFLHKLRDEKKFANFDSLKEQIALDAIAAKNFLANMQVSI